MKKLVALGLIFSIFLACDKQKNNYSEEDSISNSSLSRSEIVEIVKATMTTFDIKENVNYHLGYPTVFNDSTFTLEVAVNKVIPSKDEGVTNYMPYQKNKVFIYNCSLLKINLDTIKEEMLPESKQGSPFFIPDSKSLSLLIQKQNGDLILSKLEPLISKGVGSKDSMSTDF